MAAGSGIRLGEAVRTAVRLMLLAALLPLGVGSAQAATPATGIVGTFEGTAAVRTTGCADPADQGVSTSNVRLVIATANGSAFAGGATTAGGLQASFSGSVGAGGGITGGAFSALSPDGEVTTGSLTGSLVSGTLDLRLTGVTVDAQGAFLCNVQVRILAQRVDAQTVSEFAAGAAALGSRHVLTAVRGITGLQRARIGALLGARRGLRARALRVHRNGLLLQTPDGLAAGDGGDGIPLGAWLSWQHSAFENDFAPTAIDGDRDTVLVGLDASPSESLVAGIAVGWERSDTDTVFNRGNVDGDGIVVSPYLGWLLDDGVSLDASVGYTALSLDQFRTLPGAGTRVTSSLDADRWFWAANLTASRALGALYLSARVGVLMAREYQQAFVESNGTVNPRRTVRLGQWRAGVDAAWTWNAFEPFASATWEHDYATTAVRVAPGRAQPANDRDDVLVGAGVRWYGPAGLSASFEWTTLLGRESFDEDSVNLLLRADF